MQQLSDMTIDEISLVDEPANEQARVLIVKAAGEVCTACKGTGKDADGDVCKTCGGTGHLAKGDKETGPGEPDNENAEGEGDKPGKKKSIKKQALAGGTPADADAAKTAAAIHTENHMDIEKLSAAVKDAEAKLVTLEKRAGEAETKLAAAEAVIKAKDEEIATLKAAIPAPAAPSDEEVLKSLPEAIRKRLEDAEAETRAAKEALAKSAAEKETAEAIAKAKGYGVGDPAALGPLLLRVQKGMTTADDATTLETLLKGFGEFQKANNVVLFKSLGTAGGVDAEPEAQLQAKADEIHKAAGGKLSPQQAYAQAVEQNPALYSAYIAKRRSA